MAKRVRARKVVSALTGSVTENGKITGNIFAGFTGALRVAPSGATPEQIDAITRRQIEQKRSPAEAGRSASEVLKAAPAAPEIKERTREILERRPPEPSVAAQRLREVFQKRGVPSPFRRPITEVPEVPVRRFVREAQEKRIQREEAKKVSEQFKQAVQEVDPRKTFVRADIDFLVSQGVESISSRIDFFNQNVESLNKDLEIYNQKTKLATTPDQVTQLRAEGQILLDRVEDAKKTGFDLGRALALVSGEGAVRFLKPQVRGFVGSIERKPKSRLERFVGDIEKRKFTVDDIIGVSKKGLKKSKEQVSFPATPFPTTTKEVLKELPDFGAKLLASETKRARDIVAGGLELFGKGLAEAKIISPVEPVFIPGVGSFPFPSPKRTEAEKKRLREQVPLDILAPGELAFAFTPPGRVLAVSEFLTEPELRIDTAVGVAFTILTKGTGKGLKLLKEPVLKVAGKRAPQLRVGFEKLEKGVGTTFGVGLGTAFVLETQAELKAAQTQAEFRKISRQQTKRLGAFLLGAKVSARGIESFTEPLETKIQVNKILEKLPKADRIRAEKALEISKILEVSDGVLKGKNIKSFRNVVTERMTPKQAKIVNRYLSRTPSQLKRIIVGGTASEVPQVKGKVKAEDLDLYSKDFRIHARNVANDLRAAGENPQVVKKQGAVLIFLKKGGVSSKALEFHREDKLLANLGNSRKLFERTEWSITQTPDGVHVVKFESQVRRKAIGGIQDFKLRSEKDFGHIEDLRVTLGEPLTVKKLDLFNLSTKAQLNLAFDIPRIKGKTENRPTGLFEFGRLEEKVFEAPLKQLKRQKIKIRDPFSDVSQSSFVKQQLTGIRGTPIKSIDMSSSFSKKINKVATGQSLPSGFLFGLESISGTRTLKTSDLVSVSNAGRKALNDFSKLTGLKRIIEPRIPIRISGVKRPRRPTRVSPGRPRRPFRVSLGVPRKPFIISPGLPIDPFDISPGRPRIPREPSLPVTDEPLFPRRFFRLPKRKKEKKKVVSSLQAFDAFVKQSQFSNKFIRAGVQGLTLASARGLGIKITRGTPKRTFEVRPVSGLPRRLDFGFDIKKVLAEEFRKPIRRGQPILGSEKFVERTKFALDLPGEIEGVTKKGLAKLRELNAAGLGRRTTRKRKTKKRKITKKKRKK